MNACGEPEDVNRQAADWLARLHADDRTEGDEAAFRNWLSHPRHAEAFERASTVWDAVGGLKEDPVASDPKLSRRAVLAGASALVVTGGAVFGWREAVAGVYRTDVGEQRRLLLEDGTRVMMDTATRIRFRPGNDTRLLSLTAGRVDLEIAADPRPFLIDAGERRATIGSGRVDVRRDGDRVALTAIEGTSRIGGTPLAAGNRVVMAAGQPDRIDRPELQDLTAWQSGRLAFRNETLADAAAEMNRYTTRPLIVSGDEAVRMRLSGMYRVGDTEAFARSVAILLPVRVEADGDRVRISAIT